MEIRDTILWELAVQHARSPIKTLHAQQHKTWIKLHLYLLLERTYPEVFGRPINEERTKKVVGDFVSYEWNRRKNRTGEDKQILAKAGKLYLLNI